MILRIGAVLVLLSGAGTTVGAAQRPALGPRPSSLFAPAPASRPDPVTIRATYWKEGALIGGTLIGVLGAYVAHGLCEMDDSADPCDPSTAAVGGALVGFLLGAIPGALIGGQFEK